MSRRRRIRLLNPEEKALWHHVMRQVTPLKGRTALEIAPPPPAPVPVPEAAEGQPSPARKAEAKGGPARPTPAPPVTPLAPMEPRLRRRLNRGADVDARLDLHGMTQAAAHRRLTLFLLEAHAAGFALVLVITGKGDAEGAPLPGEERRGVLRRAVPLWLSEPGLRPYVVGFETASRRHGGEGALYVRVRRRREGTDRGWGDRDWGDVP
ncbi:Smr/MutS family protein [Aquabacter sp. L1I39]|uniref:Smr/MutS family protein n=1 Tax=Aquabacter sp. L1I39 TaxID=2820278 RepID=UPI001AD9CBA8|nr:Smr/MutS family protein [Aquabacter sp. L1I39]QTL05300.1 Smr/MutS family protein [Aquabacter sp. L1I39]